VSQFICNFKKVYLQFFDYLKYFIIRDPVLNAIGSPYIYYERMAATMLELPDGNLLTMDISGM
jgi:hypothetical protein